MMQAERGMTLIELVITVVIIGIIALLTYPSLRDTLDEQKLYTSTRSVTDVLTHARLQAIMRNQAHRVDFTFSKNGPGGSVVLRRYTSTTCDQLVNDNNTIHVCTPEMSPPCQAKLHQDVALAALTDQRNVESNITGLCFRPNGRASNATTRQLIPGGLRLVLRRYQGDQESVGWPLYVDLNNLGIATLAKTAPVIAGGVQ